MERTVVSVSRSEGESVNKVRGILQEVHGLCLSFESSMELSAFLVLVAQAQQAFEKVVRVTHV